MSKHYTLRHYYHSATPNTFLTNLIHYWKLEETQTYDKADEIGGWGLGQQGQPPQVTGKNGYACEFTTGKYLSKTGIAEQPTVLTTSMWINHDGVQNTWQVILVWGTPSVSANFQMGMGGVNGGLVVMAKPEGTSGVDVVSDQISSGEWHHIVGMLNMTNNENKLWVDGQVVGMPPYTYVGSEPSVTAMWVGASIYGSAPFFGHVDEIAMWDKELTDDDVALLWNNGDGLFFGDFE